MNSSSNMQKRLSYTYFLLLSVSIAIAASMSLFDIKLVESNDSRLIATSNYNYALTSPKFLSKGWSTVSVNGDIISIITTTGEKLNKTKLELGDGDRLFLEGIRDEIASDNNGFKHMSWSGGGGFSSSDGSMMNSGGGFGTSYSSSSTGGGNLISSSLGGGVGNGMSSMQMAGYNVNMFDDGNFSVSKSSFPFNWARVFFNGDLITIVYKNGEVCMRPTSAIEPDMLTILNNMRSEVKSFEMAHAQQVSNTMQNSMDMVSNIFGSIMGRLPKPPSLESANFGSMFGNNFPFGSNNSPFNSPSWPFSGSAFAFAG